MLMINRPRTANLCSERIAVFLTFNGKQGDMFGSITLSSLLRSLKGGTSTCQGANLAKASPNCTNGDGTEGPAKYSVANSTKLNFHLPKIQAQDITSLRP